MRWCLTPLFAVLLVAGCANDGPCEGNFCSCFDTDECEFVCNDVPCTGECVSLDTCDGTCRDSCSLFCESSSGCDFVCEDLCTVECTSVSECGIDCGADCDVSCTDLATCRVTMISGQVQCDRAGECDIRCATAAGTEPATDCGSGTFVCGSACP
ncbi:MAG: hypothetical protein JJ863_10480 [Deltaproteobacteria bacterium]|nr:hypothetical protein [Deltaproteobacteria bacterium]